MVSELIVVPEVVSISTTVWRVSLGSKVVFVVVVSSVIIEVVWSSKITI